MSTAYYMNNRQKTALILLGHGSHISPNTAGVVWDAVDNLRHMGIADEITGAFWKEQPHFRTVLSSISATDITLVPLFTAQGYFTQTVIPTEMNLNGQITNQGEKIIRYAQPPVYHLKIQQIVQARVDDAIRQYQLMPSDVGIAIIGHSTRKNASSRQSTEYQAGILQQKGIYGAVITAFLDDDPPIISIYERIDQPTIIAIPLFLAMGSHTTIDVPEAMLLPPNCNYAYVNNKQVIYTPAIGDNNDLTDLICDLARDVGAPLYNPHPPKSAWDYFPRGGWEAFQTRLMHDKSLIIGDLFITIDGVRVVDDDQATTIITSPAMLRKLIRENPFRPLMTAKGLPKGWFAPASSVDEVCAIIETVYPALISHLFVDENYQTTPINQTIRRQTGIYRQLVNLDTTMMHIITDEICGDCIRQPTWHNHRASPIACDEACNWWLSHALEKVEN